MNEEQLESAEIQEAKDILKGQEVAKANNMSYTKFKDQTTTKYGLLNDSEQWTFDYQSYLLSMSGGVYQSPIGWGDQFYQER